VAGDRAPLLRSEWPGGGPWASPSRAASARIGLGRGAIVRSVQDVLSVEIPAARHSWPLAIDRRTDARGRHASASDSCAH
jgi:hypothetical protein